MVKHYNFLITILSYPFNRDITKRITRQSNLLHLPGVRSETAKRSFYYHGCVVFNRSMIANKSFLCLYYSVFAILNILILCYLLVTFYTRYLTYFWAPIDTS